MATLASHRHFTLAASAPATTYIPPRYDTDGRGAILPPVYNAAPRATYLRTTTTTYHIHSTGLRARIAPRTVTTCWRGTAPPYRIISTFVNAANAR